MGKQAKDGRELASCFRVVADDNGHGDHRSEVAGILGCKSVDRF